MDNGNPAAPVIPSGTERTVFGTTSFPAPVQNPVGQAATPPDGNQVQPAPAQDPVQPNPANAGQVQPAPITFAELARQKGFNTPDDLAKSYAELESHTSRVSMGLSELISIRQQSQPQETPAFDPSKVETTEDAMKIISGIVAKQTQPLQDKLELQDLFFNHPDTRTLAPKMAEIVKDNPGIKWSIAYQAAKSDALESAHNTAREQGRQEAYQNIQQKQNVAAQPARPAVTNTRPIQEIIADRSIPFSEVQRIMRERFTQ